MEIKYKNFKAIALKSFISRYDTGCSNSHQMKIHCMKVYNVYKLYNISQNFQFRISAPKTPYNLNNVNSVTWLDKDEMEQNFMIIEEEKNE